MISRNDYDSFGEIVASSGISQNAVTYTGQRLDVESGLMALGNGERYYNPSYGRFIQQDSYAGMPDMPQSLNRFSYTYNNPNKYTDPSGNAVVTTLLIGGAILAAFSVGTGTVKAKRQHELEAVEQRWEANDNRLNWGSAFADGTGATQAFKGFTGTDAYKGSDYAYTGKPWWHRPWDATVGSLEVVGNAFAVSGPATQGIKAFTTGGATLRSSFQSAQGWARNTEPFKQQWGAFTNVVLKPRQTGRAIADITVDGYTSLRVAAATLRTDGFKGTTQRALNFAGEELLPRLNPRNYKRSGSDINFVGKTSNTRNISQLGLRQDRRNMLNDEQIEFVKKEFEAIGGDSNILRFNKGRQTAYDEVEDVINIRGDIFPSEIYSEKTRSVMSVRSVLAHELGHRHFRPRYLSTKPLEPGAWNDEFASSYWASRNVRGITEMDRRQLIIDATERAKEASISINPNRFMRKTQHGY